MKRNQWTNPPSGRESATYSNPTFTGTRTGVVYPLAQSGAGVAGAADTNENILATISVSAGLLRANDRIRLQVIFSQTNNANVKTVRVRIGGIGGTIALSRDLASTANASVQTLIVARNSTASQWLQSNGTDSAGTAFLTVATSTVDTTAAFDIVVTGQKATAGDTLATVAYLAEMIRA